MRIHSTLLIILGFINYLNISVRANETEDDSTYGSERYKMEGRVVRPDSSLVSDHEWFGNTRVYTNTGHHGFLREDGSFVIHNLAWGSHVVQVMNPTYIFESARVDISSKGKVRARAVNHIQPSKVDLIVYPLKLRSLGPLKYFQQREQWRMTDFLLNPMVLMTVLPLAFMMILPRLGDAETRKEMEQLQVPKVETPALSEIMTNFFGGGAGGVSSANQKAAAVGKFRPGRRKDK